MIPKPRRSPLAILPLTAAAAWSALAVAASVGDALAAGGLRAGSAAQEPDLVAGLEARIERAVSAPEAPCVGLEVLIWVGGEPLVHVARGVSLTGAPRAEGDTWRAPALARALTSVATLRLIGTRMVPVAAGVPPTAAAGAAGGAAAIEASGPAAAVEVRLDAPIGTYLTDAQFGADTVTVRALLGGTSGVAPYGDVLTREQRAGAGVPELFDVVVAHGLVAPPGHCFDPNESEELLLGALVEAATGASLADAFGGLCEAASLGGTHVADDGDCPARGPASPSMEIDFSRRPVAGLYPLVRIGCARRCRTWRASCARSRTASCSARRS
ncbi:MAG: serine hydrolase [Planctomycetota bacterium]